MYAKLFSSIYQGTLRGNTNGLVVFTNMLAHADSAGWVDIHPRAIAEETGLSIEKVKEAILELSSPDPESRSPEEEGRRIVLIDAHRDWGWRIVNHGKYRAIKSEEDRREQNRIAQKRFREKHNSNHSKQPSAQSAQAEAEAEAYKHPSSAPDGFDLFWQAYPKKVSKPAAQRAFKAAKINGHLSEVIGDIEAKKASADWQKENGQFIPNPATYLNQRRWEDEMSSTTKQTSGFV